MGTAPTITGDCSRTAARIAGRSPPVERSMTESAPASTAAESFFYFVLQGRAISARADIGVYLGPKFLPDGKKCGQTNGFYSWVSPPLPLATNSQSRSGDIPSDPAAFFSSGVRLPFFCRFKLCHNPLQFCVDQIKKPPIEEAARFTKVTPFLRRHYPDQVQGV